MAKRHPDVPPKIVGRLRAACLDLPEAYEEQAWVGTRWCIRKKTFAHVLMIADGWPPVYARAAGAPGPICVLTFQSWLPTADPERFSTFPYFLPRWRPDIVGRVLEGRIDWDEIIGFLTASYCMLAPKALVERVRRRQA